jgi:hypothetical protein
MTTRFQATVTVSASTERVFELCRMAGLQTPAELSRFVREAVSDSGGGVRGMGERSARGGDPNHRR